MLNVLNLNGSQNTLAQGVGCELGYLVTGGGRRRGPDKEHPLLLTPPPPSPQSSGGGTHGAHILGTHPGQHPGLTPTAGDWSRSSHHLGLLPC